MGDWNLRVRAILDRRFLPVVAALICLAALGGWVTYATHVAPETTTEQRPGSSWEATGQFEHAATVQEDNPVFANGTTLTNRSAYFTDVSPRLDGVFRFSYDASDRGELDQNVSLSLVMRGVEQRDRRENATVLWRTERPLGNESVGSSQPGETARVPFSFDVREVQNRTSRIEGRLGGSSGETEVFVRASVDLEGTVDGRDVNRTQTYTLPVTLRGNTYWPGDAGPRTDRYQSTQTVTVRQTYGPLRTVGGPILLVGSLVALAGLGLVRYRGQLALSPTERARLHFEDERTEFDEWISRIKLPEEALGLPQAEAASLGALVDFAIDTDNGVVEDPDDGTYYVVHDGYLYTYRPPPSHDAGDRLLPTTDDQLSEQTGEDSPSVTTGTASGNGSESPTDS